MRRPILLTPVVKVIWQAGRPPCGGGYRPKRIRIMHAG
jgi:hypothetical protein